MGSLAQPARYEYSLIVGDDKDEEESLSSPDLQISKTIQLSWQFVASCVVLLVMAAIMGFLVGQSTKWIESEHGLNSRTVLWTFNYNRTYAKAPSKESNEAWEALLPEGGGFIEDPTIAPIRSGVSVFHQIHCLDALRHGFYAQSSGVSASEEHAHERHCFDYLRQSILCAADTTIELGNDSLQGVTGMGTTHVCRDYSKIVEWALRRRPR